MSTPIINTYTFQINPNTFSVRDYIGVSSASFSNTYSLTSLEGKEFNIVDLFTQNRIIDSWIYCSEHDITLYSSGAMNYWSRSDGTATYLTLTWAGKCSVESYNPSIATVTVLLHLKISELSESKYNQVYSVGNSNTHAFCPASIKANCFAYDRESYYKVEGENFFNRRAHQAWEKNIETPEYKYSSSSVNMKYLDLSTVVGSSKVLYSNRDSDWNGVSGTITISRSDSQLSISGGAGNRTFSPSDFNLGVIPKRLFIALWGGGGGGGSGNWNTASKGGGGSSFFAGVVACDQGDITIDVGSGGTGGTGESSGGWGQDTFLTVYSKFRLRIAGGDYGDFGGGSHTYNQDPVEYYYWNSSSWSWNKFTGNSSSWNSYFSNYVWPFVEVRGGKGGGATSSGNKAYVDNVGNHGNLRVYTSGRFRIMSHSQYYNPSSLSDTTRTTYFPWSEATAFSFFFASAASGQPNNGGGGGGATVMIYPGGDASSGWMTSSAGMGGDGSGGSNRNGRDAKGIGAGGGGAGQGWGANPSGGKGANGGCFIMGFDLD